jgi:hypothetical protein
MSNVAKLRSLLLDTQSEKTAFFCPSFLGSLYLRRMVGVTVRREKALDFSG